MNHRLTKKLFPPNIHQPTLNQTNIQRYMEIKLANRYRQHGIFWKDYGNPIGLLIFFLTSKLTYVYKKKKGRRIRMIRCLRFFNLNAVFTFGMCQKREGFASLDGILPHPIYSHIHNKFYLGDWCSAMRGINIASVLNVHFYLNFGSPFFNEPFFFWSNSRALQAY